MDEKHAKIRKQSVAPADFGLIEVAKLIDNSPLSRYQILSMIMCGAVALLDGFDTQSIAFAASAMAHTLNIDIRRFGLILAPARWE